MSNSTEIQIIDFFSGCGGLSYGFANHESSSLKYRLLGGVDIDDHANSTYRRMLGKPALKRDISELAERQQLQDILNKLDFDSKKPSLFIAGAPCQGFSSHRKKDKRKDSRNSLLEIFGVICSGIRPDLVVMENVPEILQKKHWKYFSAWRETMVDSGYTVRTQIHNLAQFGVPQERFRALIVAARDWNAFSMPIPQKRPDEFVTVRQAIGHLPPLVSGGIDPDDPMHVTSNHRQSTLELIRMVPLDGGSRRHIRDQFRLPRCLRDVDGFRDVYGRLWWDKPAVAITARCRTPSCGRYIHPTQHRGLSVREAGLLQGFPGDYFFEGPFDDKFKQIGNAVSPLFSLAIAASLDFEWGKSDVERALADDYVYDVVRPLEKSFSSALAGIKRRIRQQPENRHMGLF